jgi:GAF domain-containing protein
MCSLFRVQSIDNARLYAALSENNEALELQVQARTAELEEKNKLLGAAKEAAEKATRIKADFLSNMSQMKDERRQ